MATACFLGPNHLLGRLLYNRFQVSAPTLRRKWYDISNRINISDLTAHQNPGAHEIIQAYCALLRGERITHTLHARPSLSLKSEVLEKCAEMIESHQIADLHRYSMHRTWAAGFGALGKQIGRNICYPSSRRLSKTLLVPQGQMRRWMKEAENQQARVTEHDLLVAFIYKVCVPS